MSKHDLKKLADDLFSSVSSDEVFEYFEAIGYRFYNSSNKEVDFWSSLESCLAFSPRDWSLNHRDAWLYGIVFGWDTPGDELVEGENSAMEEMRNKHGWSDSDVERLRALHEQFIRTKKTEKDKEVEIYKEALRLACREVKSMFEDRCPDYLECGHDEDQYEETAKCFIKYFLREAKDSVNNEID